MKHPGTLALFAHPLSPCVIFISLIAPQISHHDIFRASVLCPCYETQHTPCTLLGLQP